MHVPSRETGQPHHDAEHDGIIAMPNSQRFCGSEVSASSEMAIAVWMKARRQIRAD
jgi:hypothetical protein